MTCGVEINKDAWHIHVKKKTESKVIVKNMTHDNYMTRVESCSCHCQRISTIVIYINLLSIWSLSDIYTHTCIAAVCRRWCLRLHTYSDTGGVQYSCCATVAMVRLKRKHMQLSKFLKEKQNIGFLLYMNS